MLLRPKRLAMEAFDSPWAQSSTIRDRSTTPCGSERERAIVSSWFFCASERTMGATGRPRGMSLLPGMDTLSIISIIYGTEH